MIVAPDTLAGMLPAKGRLMALDLGTKTIGVAVTDMERRLTRPLTTLQRRAFRQDAADLLRLADREQALALILGLPLNMDGSEGPRAQSTRAFARNLAGLTDLPILLEDERLSTAEAGWAMREAGIKRRQREATIDAEAAAAILARALTRLGARQGSA
jgi:putative Holliday junction resolvase